MADTGTPLFLPLPVRGEEDWDDDLNGALGTLNTNAQDTLDALVLKANLVDGKVPSAELPTVTSAISVTPVADQAARLAFSSAIVGTAVIQITDPTNGNGTIYILSALPYSTDVNWIPAQPGTTVTSYNGQTGTLTGKPEYSTVGTWALKQTFTVSPGVPTASASDAPVPFAQMTSAISAATTSGPAGRYTVTIGNGTDTSFALTHGRANQFVIVQCSDATTNKVVYPDEVTLTSSTVVTISFIDAPANNSVKVTVI